MLGPVALIASRSSWIAVAVTAILCGILCGVVYRLWGENFCESKLINILFLLWHIYAAAEVAFLGCLCWPGKGSQIVIPAVLILLSALSAYQGERSAGAVAGILCPLCTAVFALVLASGIGNIRWDRMELPNVPPSGMLIFVFLLPTVALTIPRKESPSEGGLALIGIWAALLSAAVMGTLSLGVMLTRQNAFYEFSKSLNIFGTVQRFESMVAVAVTLSLYAMLSLLMSSIKNVAENIYPEAGKLGVFFAVFTSVGILVLKLRLNDKAIAALSIIVWGFVVIAYRFLDEKNYKKQDDCA